MNDALLAPADLIADLSDLDRSLKEDAEGSRALAMVAYFDAAIKTSAQLLERAAGADQRKLLLMLHEGFLACRAIVVQVWQDLHRVPLCA